MSATARSTEGGRAQVRDRGRVLLITEEKAGAAYVEALAEAGLDVVGVEGGAAALVAHNSARPHVVVADVRIKGISAFELALTRAKQEDATPTVLVGLEAADAAQRLAALEAGAFDYFRVPSEAALLVARLRQLVSLKQAIEKLRAEADRDHLTGLANRRRFRKALGQEIERWRRYGVPCALLLLDIDHMKRINDTHGHTAGDMVIRSVSGALSEHSRNNDTAARLGGEEFALLLAGVDGPNAVAAAERIRNSIAGAQIEMVGCVTVSLGVASCPDHARAERELFAASDAALYQAKRDGRNQTVVAAAL